MSWLLVTIKISKDEIEDCEKLLLKHDAISVSIQNDHSEIVLEPDLGETPFWTSVKLAALFKGDIDRSNLIARLTDYFNPNKFDLEYFEDRNWLEAHKKNLKPIIFGNKLCIYPSWISPPENIPFLLTIDPGLAFGTGEHPTTWLCLERLSEMPLYSKLIVDFGCGSGILALAALRLSASKALGIDLDPQALSASRSNALINNLEPYLELASPEDSKLTNWHGKADLVIANIVANPLKKLAHILVKMLKPEGTLILSGILERQGPEIISYYDQLLQLEQEKTKDGWLLLQGRLKN